MMNENISVSVQNISKEFIINKKRGIDHAHLKKSSKNNYEKKLKALDNISFNVSKGECFGIIGLNGSGKSTLLKIISGIYFPDQGTIKIDGVLAPLLHLGSSFHDDLIASENIIMYGMLMGLTKHEIKDKVEEIMEFAELKKFFNLQLKHYSTGMRARLGFSTAMHVNSDILIIDEILGVGDRIFKEKAIKVFKSYRGKKTILLATHSLEDLSEYCDRILLLDRGKMMLIGKPDDVIEKYKEIKTVSSK